MIIHRNIYIEGKVQGVFYRASAKEFADALQLNGWIYNTADGNVQAYVSGEESLVMKFINWCKQGPPLAEVKNVSVHDCQFEEVTGFHVK
jgi:acylphosphatase